MRSMRTQPVVRTFAEGEETVRTWTDEEFYLYRLTRDDQG